MEPRPEDPIKSFVVPAPTGGLNYKEALPLMSPDTAISMSNLIPNGATVDVRRGIEHLVTIESGYKGEAIAPLESATGKTYHIVCGSKVGNPAKFGVFNMTASPAVKIDEMDLVYLSTVPCQRVMFTSYRNELFILRPGFQKIIKITPPAAATSDSTDVFTTASYYGSAMGSYNSRIYISDGSTQKLWYTEVDQVAGAMPAGNSYNISSLLTLGGQVVFCGSVIRQEGSLSQNLLGVVTDKGEVLIFQGSYPGSTTWAIVARYIIPRPLGSGAFFYIGNSLYILTESSLVSLADLSINYEKTNNLSVISTKINPWLQTITTSAMSDFRYRDLVSAAYHAKTNRVFISLPYPKMPLLTAFGVLVVDIETRAWGFLDYPTWFNYLTCIGSEVYAIADSETYKLEAKDNGDDVFNLSTGSWTENAISYSAQLAPNYNEDFSTTKQFTEVKALVQCKSPYSITAGLTVDFDLRSCGTTNYSKMTGGTYGLYQPRFNAGDRENVGKCCILNIGGQAGGADLPMKFIAFEVYYTTGGNW